MPYTIRPSTEDFDSVIETVQRKLQEDGRFTAKVFVAGEFDIHVLEIRKGRSESYCGQHAGECDLPRFFTRPKRKRRLLEWFDFIEFNRLINDAIDDLDIPADVWSLPMDTRLDKGQKLWIRRGERARLRYDIVGIRGGAFNSTYVADHGSPSQFEQEAHVD